MTVRQLRGLEIGVTESVSLSALDLIIGGGRRKQGLASQKAGLLDWYAEAVGWSFILLLLLMEFGYRFENVTPIRRLRSGKKTR